MQRLHGPSLRLRLDDPSTVSAQRQASKRLWNIDGTLGVGGNVSVFSCEATETGGMVQVTLPDSPQFFTPPPD